MKAVMLILCLAAGVVGTFIVVDHGIVPYPAPPSEWRTRQAKAVHRACQAGSYDRSAGGRPTPSWMRQSGGEGLHCVGTGAGNVAGAAGRLVSTLVAAFRIVDIFVGIVAGLLLYFILSAVARFFYTRAVHPPLRHFAPTVARHMPAPGFRPRPRDGGACFRL